MALTRKQDIIDKRVLEYFDSILKNASNLELAALASAEFGSYLLRQYPGESPIDAKAGIPKNITHLIPRLRDVEVPKDYANIVRLKEINDRILNDFSEDEDPNSRITHKNILDLRVALGLGANCFNILLGEENKKRGSLTLETRTKADVAIQALKPEILDQAIPAEARNDKKRIQAVVLPIFTIHQEAVRSFTDLIEDFAKEKLKSSTPADIAAGRDVQALTESLVQLTDKFLLKYDTGIAEFQKNCFVLTKEFRSKYSHYLELIPMLEQIEKVVYKICVSTADFKNNQHAQQGSNKIADEYFKKFFDISADYLQKLNKKVQSGKGDAAKYTDQKNTITKMLAQSKEFGEGTTQAQNFIKLWEGPTNTLKESKPGFFSDLKAYISSMNKEVEACKKALAPVQENRPHK